MSTTQPAPPTNGQKISSGVITFMGEMYSAGASLMSSGGGKVFMGVHGQILGAFGNILEGGGLGGLSNNNGAKAAHGDVKNLNAPMTLGGDLLDLAQELVVLRKMGIDQCGKLG